MEIEFFNSIGGVLLLLVIWFSFWAGMRFDKFNHDYLTDDTRRKALKKAAIVALIFAIIGIFTLGKTPVCSDISGRPAKIDSPACFENYEIDPDMDRQQAIFIGVFSATFLPFAVGLWLRNKKYSKQITEHPQKEPVIRDKNLGIQKRDIHKMNSTELASFEELVQKAIKLVQEKDMVSTAILQWNFRIRYVVAKNLMFKLKELEVIENSPGAMPGAVIYKKHKR